MAPVNAAPELDEHEPEITAEQRQHDMALVATLSGLQKQLGLTDVQLCKRHLEYTAPAWVSLRNGSYAAKDWSNARGKIRKAIESINAFLDKKQGAQALVRFQYIDDVVNGVKVARREERDRFVLLLAPTGGGKSKMQDILRAEPVWGAQIVAMECVATMETSTMAFLTKLGEVLDITDLPNVTWKAGNVIAAALEKTPRLLYFDELHHGGPGALNFIKRIINETASVCIGVAIPELWRNLTRNRAFVEASQIISRMIAKVIVTRLEPEDARRFCEARVDRWNEAEVTERKAIVKRMAECCTAASGMVDAASLFARFLNLHAMGNPPTDEAAVKAQLGLEAVRK
jgi:hypothetical protein